ncbi:MAG: response regulator [Nitrospiraceae bacterium]|nr:response regulator [Nitrospiraceae bacterium]
MMKRILVVEDEVVTAMSLCDLLRMWGYEVSGPVSDGQAAINKAISDLPEIVLIDVKIRGDMDGIETGKQINSRLGIPVILMTGYPKHELKDKMKDIPGAQYISKPFDLEKLKTMIENGLSIKKI